MESVKVCSPGSHLVNNYLEILDSRTVHTIFKDVKYSRIKTKMTEDPKEKNPKEKIRRLRLKQREPRLLRLARLRPWLEPWRRPRIRKI